MIWIHGNSESGKTTLAKRLKTPNTIILDGDELRKVWELGFSKKDRWEQNMRAAKLGDMLEWQGFEVIIATICPYKELRREISKRFNVRWIQLDGGKSPSKEYPYEPTADSP